MKEPLQMIIREEISVLYESEARIRELEMQVKELDWYSRERAGKLHSCQRFYYALEDIMGAYEGEVPVSPQERLNQVIALVNRTSEELVL